MSWKAILKRKFGENLVDSKRLGNMYALKDIFESKKVDNTTFDSMSREDKTKHHSILYTLLNTHKDSSDWSSLKEEQNFHYAMYRRGTRDSKRYGQVPMYNSIESRNRAEPNGLKLAPKEKKVKQVKPRTELEKRFIRVFDEWLLTNSNLPTIYDFNKLIRRKLTTDEKRTFRKTYDKYKDVIAREQEEI
tara:strand:+ start:1333 stop:1902 length:570 start_codon:yes stop_codon:yes gene_type:complete